MGFLEFFRWPGLSLRRLLNEPASIRVPGVPVVRSVTPEGLRLVYVAAGQEAWQRQLLHVAEAWANRAPLRRAAHFHLTWVLTHEFELTVMRAVRFGSAGLFAS